MTSLPIWDVTQRTVVFIDVSGHAIGPFLKGPGVQEDFFVLLVFLNCLTLEDGTDCPETSVRNYQSTVRNIPEEST